MHCADLHLGSRFSGVTSQDEALGKRLVSATYDALENVVELANREVVDFVIFSGDIFDSSNETPYARTRFADAVSRIKATCFIAYGNHDYRRLWEDTIPLPDNAVVFGERPEHFFFPSGPEAKVCITGISHSRKTHGDSLAVDFEPEKGFFNIGVVHCDVDARDSPYSPVPLRDLMSKGFDYWALGHIHKSAILSTDPYVVYPGCTQGRSSKESGSKGVYMITVVNNRVAKAEFFETQAVMWIDTHVTIDESTTLPSLVSVAAGQCPPGSLVRLFVDGTGPLNSKLRLYSEDVRHMFEESSGCVCIDMIVTTRPEMDLEARSKVGDFTAMVIEHGRDMKKVMSRQQIVDAICTTGASEYLRPVYESMSTEDLRRLLDDAINYVIERMREAESE